VHSAPLLQLLDDYLQTAPPEESGTIRRFRTFIRENEDCYSRSLLEGHLTGSAWIVTPAFSHCLLIHHRKLNRWLQPGGHADGIHDIQRVARKEATEETGLTSPVLYTPAIFDLDIHTIPERKEVPEHLHYDVRFIYVADPEAPLNISPETNHVAWWSLQAAEALVQENDSILRMIQKTRLITAK